MNNEYFRSKTEFSLPIFLIFSVTEIFTSNPNTGCSPMYWLQSDYIGLCGGYVYALSLWLLLLLLANCAIFIITIVFYVLAEYSMYVLHL